jgi:hypothetical protein
MDFPSLSRSNGSDSISFSLKFVQFLRVRRLREEGKKSQSQVKPYSHFFLSQNFQLYEEKKSLSLTAAAATE